MPRKVTQPAPEPRRGEREWMFYGVNLKTVVVTLFCFGVAWARIDYQASDLRTDFDQYKAKSEPMLDDYRVSKEVLGEVRKGLGSLTAGQAELTIALQKLELTLRELQAEREVERRYQRR